MRWEAAVFLAVLASSSMARQSTEPYLKDSRLKSPISMRMKTASLTDFTASLQHLTKVHFSVAADIADRKITAVFHDRPAAELMGAVQDAMFMQWKKVGSDYRLVLPINVDREERDQISTEEEAFRSGLVRAIRGFVEVYGLSKDEVDRRDKAIRAKMVALKSDTTTDGMRQLASARQDLGQLNSIAGAALCSVLAGNLQNVVDSLFAGNTVFASSLPSASGPQLPSGFMDQLLVRIPTAKACVVLMRLNFAEQRIEGEAIISTSDRGGNTVTDLFYYSPLLHDQPVNKPTKLMARLQKWQVGAEPGVLAKAITSGGRVEDKPGYFARFSPGLTLAEHLEYIADHADIPVVGDAFRIYCSGPAFLPENTVHAYIDRLRSSSHIAGSLRIPPVSFFSTRAGWLLARHQAYWRKLLVDAPESLLIPLETAARDKDYPSVEDYARFVGGLTTTQATALEANSFDMALRFDPLPFQSSLASLRLWSILTTDQAKTAESSGFALSNLSPAQAGAVLDGWYHKMWRGGIPASIWPELFSPTGLSTSQPVLFMRRFEFNQVGSPRQIATTAAEQRADFGYHLGESVQIHDQFVVTNVHP